MTTQIIHFDIGNNSKSTIAPTLPAPLNPDEFHTRQELREHQAAQQDYYDHQRQVENQTRIDTDNQRAKDLAESRREQTDDAYDSLKRKQWQEQKDKQAAILAKEKSDALEKTAYLLSSPAIADVFTRSEFTAIQAIIHWASRNYTLEDDGFLSFGNGVFHVQMTAPKKAAK